LMAKLTCEWFDIIMHLFDMSVQIRTTCKRFLARQTSEWSTIFIDPFNMLIEIFFPV